VIIILSSCRFLLHLPYRRKQYFLL